MGINKTYAVFGLGRYGIAVANELVSKGAEVIAVDIDEDIVNDVSSEIPYCKCADITDAEVISFSFALVSATYNTRKSSPLVSSFIR